MASHADLQAKPRISGEYGADLSLRYHGHFAISDPEFVFREESYVQDPKAASEQYPTDRQPSAVGSRLRSHGFFMMHNAEITFAKRRRNFGYFTLPDSEITFSKERDYV